MNGLAQEFQYLLYASIEYAGQQPTSAGMSNETQYQTEMRLLG
jgi:hypothetical protein